VTGFDLEADYLWHAEDIGWPLKKSGNNTINDEVTLPQAA